jgi:hypothetical protein
MGRPAKYGQAMTAAERKRLQREREREQITKLVEASHETPVTKAVESRHQTTVTEPNLADADDEKKCAAMFPQPPILTPCERNYWAELEELSYVLDHGNLAPDDRALVVKEYQRLSAEANKAQRGLSVQYLIHRIRMRTAAIDGRK